MSTSDHIHGLEVKNERLKREIRIMQEVAEARNRQIRASGYIVRCTGCMAGGPPDAEDMTEERVREVEDIARRLREWFENNKGRDAIPDHWDAHRDRMIRQIREGIEWLGADAFVELLIDDWPGDTEVDAIGPDGLADVLNKWLKEKES
jgi:hypothetical protein